MKKRFFQFVLSFTMLLSSAVGLPTFYAFADTDGSEFIVVQPEQLEIQLGSDWIGAEFQLRTDHGLYPNPIPVDQNGILRLEIGGSSKYTLSCISSGRTTAFKLSSDDQSLVSSELVTTETLEGSPAPASSLPSPTAFPDNRSDPEIVEPDDEKLGAVSSSERNPMIAGIPARHALVFAAGLFLCTGVLVALRVASKRSEVDDDFDDYDE